MNWSAANNHEPTTPGTTPEEHQAMPTLAEQIQKERERRQNWVVDRATKDRDLPKSKDAQQRERR